MTKEQLKYFIQNKSTIYGFNMMDGTIDEIPLVECQVVRFFNLTAEESLVYFMSNKTFRTDTYKLSDLAENKEDLYTAVHCSEAHKILEARNELL